MRTMNYDRSYGLAFGLAVFALSGACGDDSPSLGSAGNGDTAQAGQAGGAAGSGATSATTITAPDKQWTWIPFDDSTCRDGSPAGISVSLNAASKKVMLYLEGGGACFDVSTCASNPAAIAAKMPADTGVFDRTQADNPVADWNFVYVPYCSGDVHIGDAQDVTIPGVTGVQQFHGRSNLEAFLKRVVPTFAKADQVLLTGVSAGGFGASSNAEFVQDKFGAIPVTMIDDSGPGFSQQFLPKCEFDLQRMYWGLDSTLIALCGSDCTADGDFAVEYAAHVAKKSNGAYSGLIESDQDQVIRLFNGIATNNGANDCMGTLGPTPMDATLFESGLLDIRKRMSALNPNFGTYFPSSMQHTWIGGAALYTETAGDNQQRMVDWFKDILTGKAAAQVGM
jgi:hypothetical protein